MIIDPNQALKLIEEDFPKFYLCPHCNSTASTAKTQENKIDKRIIIDYRGCNCLSLRYYNDSKSFSYKEALVLHVADKIQWMYYLPSTYQPKMQFKVVEGADRFAVEQILIYKSTLSYDHIPSFVFKPAAQMLQNIETLMTFQ